MFRSVFWCAFRLCMEGMNEKNGRTWFEEELELLGLLTVDLICWDEAGIGCRKQTESFAA